MQKRKLDISAQWLFTFVSGSQEPFFLLFQFGIAAVRPAEIGLKSRHTPRVRDSGKCQCDKNLIAPLVLLFSLNKREASHPGRSFIRTHIMLRVA